MSYKRFKVFLTWLTFLVFLTACGSIDGSVVEAPPETAPIENEIEVFGTDDWLAVGIGSSPIKAKLSYNNDFFKREIGVVIESFADKEQQSSVIAKNNKVELPADTAIIVRIAKISTGSAASFALAIADKSAQSKNSIALVLDSGGLISFLKTESNKDNLIYKKKIIGQFPIWLKLSKSSDMFTAEYSSDGIKWQELGSPARFETKGRAEAEFLFSTQGSGKTNIVIDSIQFKKNSYYISPNGSDANTGTKDSPWKTFKHAIGQLKPGDELILKDGIYKNGSTGVLEISKYSNAKNGTVEFPISVKAEHERRALIDGGGNDFPLLIDDRSYWIIEGIAARNHDKSGSKSHRGHVFFVKGDKNDISRTSGIILKRVLAYWPNRYGNNHGILIEYCQDIVVEEAEVYSFHRHGIDAYGSSRVVIRRAYINSNNQADRPGARGRSRGESLLKTGGDEAITFYGSSNSIVENSIAENRQTGFMVNGGIWPESAASDNRFVARDNLFVGNINYKGVIGAGVNSREYYGKKYQAASNVFENLLIINPEAGDFDSGRGLNIYSVPNLTLKNITIYSNYQGYDKAPKVRAVLTRERSDIKCEELSVSGYKCGFELSNSLIWSEGSQDFQSYVFSLRTKPSKNLVEHNNFYGYGKKIGADEDIYNSSGDFRHNGTKSPSGFTKYNSAAKRFLVWIPEASNMKSAAKNGADIGANIRKRYYNGTLTDEDLWKNAEFPCGAEVPNSLINNTHLYKLGSCRQIAERLHVTHP